MPGEAPEENHVGGMLLREQRPCLLDEAINEPCSPLRLGDFRFDLQRCLAHSLRVRFSELIRKSFPPEEDYKPVLLDGADDHLHPLDLDRVQQP